MKSLSLATVATQTDACSDDWDSLSLVTDYDDLDSVIGYAITYTL